jgi:hypothetical protein
MAYTPPARGQLNWDTDLNASLDALHTASSDAGVAGYVNDSASSTRAALASSLSGGVTATVRFGTDPQAMLITDTLGTSGRRLSIEPINQGTSTSTAQLQLVPGAANVSSSSIPSQIQLMNKTGDNYERFSFSCVNDQYVIDSTYNGTGLARGIVIQMGGSVSNAISGQNAALFYSDASVDLNGSSYVAFGKTWGATRTRIADQNNTGDSRLVIATRTTTPTNNVADSCSIELTRGGTAKWNVGLNFSGQNVDSLDFYNRTNSSPRMQLMETGELILRGNAPSNYGGVIQLVSTVGHNWRIGEFGSAGQLLFRDVSTGNYPLTLGSAGGVGFWGHTPPATQPAAPVTLADVIAIIRGCGLSA